MFKFDDIPIIDEQPKEPEVIRYCVLKDTITVIDGSSNSDEVMIQNAANAGYVESDIEILTEVEYQTKVEGLTNTLEQIKTERIAKLKEECTNAIYEGFTATNSHTYGFNAHDQMNMTQTMMLILGGCTDSFDWKTLDAGVVSHTVEEFMKVIDDARTHKQSKQEKYWLLETQILNAATIEEVGAVVW